MAIDRDVLNLKVLTAENKVTTGSYMTSTNNSAVVLRVNRESAVVHFVSFKDGTLRLEAVPLFAFVRDFPYKLPNYPVKRALRVMDRHAPYEVHAKNMVRTILNS